MRSKQWMVLPLLMITLFSCVKDPVPLPKTKLQVILVGSALTRNEIDSVNLVLRNQSGIVKTLYPVYLRDGYIEFWLPTGQNGTFTADVEIYTKTVNNKSLQYTIVKPVEISGIDEMIVWDGPGAQSGNGWSKRHVKSTAGNDIVVIIPDDVYDPYFEIRVKRNHWNAFQVERLGLQGSAVVAFKTWKCENGCPGSTMRITNKDFFLPFTQTIQQQSWTTNYVNISVGHKESQEYVDFEHEWSK